MAGTIANVHGGMMTCETVLTRMCSGGNVDVWLLFSGNGAGSDITIDVGPW